MAQRRYHYEQAFEWYLRARRIPYVSVNEARKALLPGARLAPPSAAAPAGARAIKSFDFVVYGRGLNLLLDVKGRKVAQPRRASASAPTRLDSWVTREDIASLRAWRTLFGEGFDAGFVFLYWCEAPPPDGLFQEVFEHGGRWYIVRAVRVEAYAAAMRDRSERWGTVHVPGAAFERISQPFCAPPCLQRSAAG